MHGRHAAVVACCAAMATACPPAAHPLDGGDPADLDGGVVDGGVRPGLVQIDGGFYDGYWTIEGTEQCSPNHGCRAQLSSTGLGVASPIPLPAEIRGQVGDAGPGMSTVSFDGGQIVVAWPTVEGRTFAAPAVGERIFIDVESFGNVEESPGVDIYSEGGRILVASEMNPMFTLEEDPATPWCTFPSYEAECCCFGYRDGLVRVHADSTVLLRECDEAEVRVGGLPFHVVVWSAEVPRPEGCGEQNWHFFGVGGFALVE